MKKNSSFERVVGAKNKEEEEEILIKEEERFDDQFFEDIEGKEREKTLEELKIIELANGATNEISRKYGLDDFDIPSKNIHIIKEEEWPKEADAFYKPMMQAIAFKEQPIKIVFLKKMIHEMLHFKSYNAIQITDEEKPKLSEYRIGLTVDTRDGKKMYLRNLNEAVTEEATKRLLKKLFINPIFENEIKKTVETVKNYPDAKLSTGEPLFEKDTFYAEVIKGEEEEKKTKIKTEVFSKQLERRVFNKLIEKIFERNPGKFKDKEEIFEVFLKGMMTGDILPVGRLVDKTFSKGTLRKIGELDSDIKMQEEFVDSL